MCSLLYIRMLQEGRRTGPLRSNRCRFSSAAAKMEETHTSALQPLRKMPQSTENKPNEGCPKRLAIPVALTNAHRETEADKS